MVTSVISHFKLKSESLRQQYFNFAVLLIKMAVLHYTMHCIAMLWYVSLECYQCDHGFAIIVTLNKQNSRSEKPRKILTLLQLLSSNFSIGFVFCCWTNCTSAQNVGWWLCSVQATLYWGYCAVQCNGCNGCDHRATRCAFLVAFAQTVLQQASASPFWELGKTKIGQVSWH